MTEPDATLVDEEYDIVVDDVGPRQGIDIFNTRAFHELHRATATAGHYFVLRHRRSNAPAAVVHFLEFERGTLASPARGSYGGFQAVGGTLPAVGAMDRFVQLVDERLQANGARHISVVLPPLAYGLDECSTWIHALLRAQYRITRHELNYAIQVTGSFEDGLDRGNRKQLRKAEREGLVAFRFDREGYEAAYEIIVENRRKKGRTPSMTWPSLEAMCDRFPDEMRFFGVSHDGTLVASAICILVNAQTLYVFYWGDVAGVESLSPVTFLARHIHEHCVSSGIGLLDLGTATVHGEPDQGLIRYKRHLGAQASLKFTMSRVVA